MKQYTEAELERASDFSQLLLSNEELAILLELEPSEIRLAISDRESLLGKAILNGRLKTKAELHRSQIDLAIRGSSPAQSAVEQLLKSI